MNGKEFIKRAQAYGKANGLDVRLVKNQGKGGHQRLYVGNHKTVVQTGEIAKGTYYAMLKQLNIPKDKF